MFWFEKIYPRIFILALLGFIFLEFSPEIQAAQGISFSRSRKLFEQGVEHYNSGRYYRALDIFRRLKNHPPQQSPQLTASILMCMKSYARLGRLNEVKSTAREFFEKYNESDYTPFIFETLGDAYLTEGYYGAALEAYLDARRLYKKPLRENHDNKIIEIATGYVDFEKLNSLAATELDQSLQAILSLAIAKKLIDQGNRDEAALLLFKLNRMLLPKEFINIYENLKSKTYAKNQGSKTIGIILESGQIDENHGSPFIQGVYQALSQIQNQYDYSLNVQVIESEDPISSIRALETLSRNNNILAIIGPTENSSALAVAASGNNGSTPILLPSIDIDGIADLGKSVYQMNSTLSLQGRYAAKYAIENLKLSTIAVLSPMDQFGKGLTDGFLAQADELGAEIIAVEWYSGIPVDLSSQLKSIRKVAFELERKKPKKILGEIKIDTSDNTFELSSTDFFQDDISNFQKEEVDSSEMTLSTIDAIYLPIHTGDINYVASQFSAYGLETQIIGNSNWYNFDEINQEMIGPNLQDMIILSDYLYPKESQYSNEAFELVSSFESQQEIIMALNGYDITTFLGKHLLTSDSRASIKTNLENSSLSKGLSRNYNISSSRSRLDSSLFILRYLKNRLPLEGEYISDSLFTYIKETP